MGDIDVTTGDVTLYDENGNPLTVINDNGVHRLAVSTSINTTQGNEQNFSNLWQIETFNGHGFSTISNEIVIGELSEVNFFLIKHPVSTGKIIRLQRFIFNLDKGTTTTKATARFYRAPTITNDGTQKTIFKIRQSQSDISVLNIFELPTITDKGVLINSLNFDTQRSLERYQDLGRYIEEGNNLLITIEPRMNNTLATFMMEWAEVDL